jgi:hypothetical protein
VTIRVRSLPFITALAGAALVVAACGGAASPGASDGGASTEPLPSVAIPSVDIPSGAIPSVDINIGGSLPADFVQELVPPSPTVVGSATAPEGQVVIFRSSASRDELKSFYEAAFRSLGAQAFTTLDTAEALAWVFTGEGSDAPSGLVAIAPDPEGGMAVTVTYGFSS